MRTHQSSALPGYAVQGGGRVALATDGAAATERTEGEAEVVRAILATKLVQDAMRRAASGGNRGQRRPSSLAAIERRWLVGRRTQKKAYAKGIEMRESLANFHRHDSLVGTAALLQLANQGHELISARIPGAGQGYVEVSLHLGPTAGANRIPPRAYFVHSSIAEACCRFAGIDMPPVVATPTVASHSYPYDGGISGVQSPAVRKQSDQPETIEPPRPSAFAGLTEAVASAMLVFGPQTSQSKDASAECLHLSGGPSSVRPSSAAAGVALVTENPQSTSEFALLPRNFSDLVDFAPAPEDTALENALDESLEPGFLPAFEEDSLVGDIIDSDMAYGMGDDTSADEALKSDFLKSDSCEAAPVESRILNELGIGPLAPLEEPLVKDERGISTKRRRFDPGLIMMGVIVVAAVVYVGQKGEGGAGAGTGTKGWFCGDAETLSFLQANQRAVASCRSVGFNVEVAKAMRGRSGLDARADVTVVT
jgi:hypothetical protein